MKRKIRATFSAETNSVNVDLPRGWDELTQSELEHAHRIAASYEGVDVRFVLFRALASFSVTRKPQEDGKFKCVMPVRVGKKLKNFVFWLDGSDLAEWMDELDWIYDPGDKPVRLDRVRGIRAVNAQLHGVTFEDYLCIENYYQGFLQSKSRDAFAGLCKMLYPSPDEEWKHQQDWLLSNVLTWIVQVKNLFAKQFPNLFKPGGKDAAPNMLEIMNNELRILSGGDVTKERTVLQVDCWRALTELDAKAKEAEELKRQTRKNHGR